MLNKCQKLHLLICLGTHKLWPGVFIFNALPALVCLVGLPFCPESPRYLLITRGKEEEARTGRYVLYLIYLSY